MKKRIFLLLVCLISSALTVSAQKNLSGGWKWTNKPDKNKMQTYFAIDLKLKNGKVAGTMYFGELENGEATSDGSITPFIGTIKGDTVTLEFDPEVYEPSYTKNLRYKKPKGKLPATATLKLKNGKLGWTQVRGILSDGMPKQFVLTK